MARSRPTLSAASKKLIAIEPAKIPHLLAEAVHQQMGADRDPLWRDHRQAGSRGLDIEPHAATLAWCTTTW